MNDINKIIFEKKIFFKIFFVTILYYNIKKHYIF